MSAPVLYVVPTYNRAGELARTIGAIAAQRWPDDRKSILVVDNASTDTTGAVLAALARTLACPLEHLRKAPEGPTVARNLGLRRGAGGYVALVDSDVELSPGWTAAAVAALEEAPDLAQVGGPLLFGHDHLLLNSFGGEVGFLGLAWDWGEGGPASQAAEARDVAFVNTSAVLMRPEPVLDVGGFDESFFYAYEEPDLGLRLALAGYRSRVVPGAVAYHHVDLRIVPGHPEFVFHYTKNRIRMGLKAYGGVRLALFAALSLGYGIADALLHRPRGARWRALWWNVMQLRQTWRARRRAQALRTVPDREAFRLLSRRWFPPRRLRGLRRRVVDGAQVATGQDDRVTTGGAP
jgi:GT2 family glycosyltransferase